MNVSDFRRYKKYIYMELFQKFYPLKIVYDRYISRKTLIAILLTLVLLLYLWPFLYRNNKNKFISSYICSTSSLSQELKNFENNDDYIVLTPSKYTHAQSNPYFPFTGNGYIGYFGDAGVINDENNDQLFIKHKILTISVPFFPIININNKEKHLLEESTVLSLLYGQIWKYSSIKLKTDCYTLKQTLYVHRTVKSLFVQNFKIQNPSNTILSFTFNSNLSQVFTSSNANIKKFEKYLSPGMTGTKALHEIEHGFIDGLKLTPPNMFNGLHTSFQATAAGGEQSNFFLYAKYLHFCPKSLEVTSHSMIDVKGYTFFRYFLLMERINSSNTGIFDQIDKLIIKDMKEVFGKDNNDKVEETHITAWNEIWKSGFSIAHSKSPNALNGDRINVTFYNFLCHQETKMEGEHLWEPQNIAFAPGSHSSSFISSGLGNCYSSHSTLLSPTLWSPSTPHNTLISLWRLTLDKNGCGGYLIKSNGLSQAMQALIFSVGSFKLSNNHLEFGMDPSDLHRDMIFRNLIYKNMSYLTIEVVIGEDNRASLRVTAIPFDDSNKAEINLYACDAGCQDPLIVLKNTPTTFPIKQTTPLTSIFYVSEDRQHLLDLKHTLHLRDVVLAPAHGHDVIALHKHGSHHSLPTLFWCSVAILIILFHLFLFKLIYSEYFGGGGSSFQTNKYSV